MFAALATLLLVCGLPATPAPAGAEQEVAAFRLELITALRQGDRAVLERFIADGFTFVLSQLGYSREEWSRLATDLREQHLTQEAAPGRLSPYGVKYEILGRLEGPSGRAAWVRTIWIVLTGQTQPRLVTLVPGEKA